MANSSTSSHELEEYKKDLRARFSDYEYAVTFISSIESWFEHRWGEDGQEVAGQLEDFDRFPDLDGLTPDFLAFFATPYVICGEYKKTWRRKSQQDVQQVMSYSRHRPEEYEESGYDVLLLVATHSDDVAKETITQAVESGEETGSPIVTVGYMLDQERVNGEWYDLKWRASDNDSFSSPNVLSEDTEGDDLNDLLVHSDHHAIPVDQYALTVAGQVPLINDAPPPVYMAIRVLIPALNTLLNEEQRDLLSQGEDVIVRVTREELLNTELLGPFAIREGWVQSSLDWLENIGMAEKEHGEEGRVYDIKIGPRLINHTEKVLIDKAARHLRREAKEDEEEKETLKGQTRLFDA